MRFSLVVATLGRFVEFERLLESLKHVNEDFEVVAVDQNGNNLIQGIIDEYSTTMKIIHVKIEGRGANYARNLGALYSSGDILTFPDDDCWYQPDTLKLVSHILREKNISGVFGRAVDELGKDSVANFPKDAELIDKNNTWFTTIESCFFIFREVFFDIGGFDESLGPGPYQRYGAHEIDDFVLRGLGEGYAFFYTPEIRVLHNQVNDLEKKKIFKRAYSYGLGMGYVAKRHGISLLNVYRLLLRPALGQIYYIRKNRLKSNYYYLTWRARLLGWQEGNE